MHGYPIQDTTITYNVIPGSSPGVFSGKIITAADSSDPSQGYDDIIIIGDNQVVVAKLSDVLDNLNPNFQLREYQISAITRFIEYFENEQNKKLPIQLLFNMATGSGKTILMVAFMLYLYEQGYRHFVFFVDFGAGDGRLFRATPKSTQFWPSGLRITLVASVIQVDFRVFRGH